MSEIEPEKNAAVVPEVPAAPVRPRKVYSGMWGIPEIAAIAVGAVAVLVVGLFYFLFVLPSNRELARNRSEADRLEADVVTARARYGEITDTQGQVDKIVASVNDFEAQHLPLIANGQSALYQRLNGLMAAHGLVNTSGPDYAPLETADADAGEQTDEEKGRSRFRSLYPGVYVTTTLEGPYQNLRRFIRDIETGREFIIVSAVELAPSENDETRAGTEQAPADAGVQNMPANPYLPAQPGRGGAPGMERPAAPQGQPQRRSQGKMHGEVVSLRIEMATYFRRPGVATTEVPQ